MLCGKKGKGNIIVEYIVIFHMSAKKNEIPFMTEALGDVSKTSNEFIRKKELIEYAEEKLSKEHPFLYPTLNDPAFSEKIAAHKEFYDTQYDGTVLDIEKHANEMCKQDFELTPHQLFVKNFLSFETPYNSLLLYHGLGSGKTCSSIGIAEEMRSYMKQVGIKQRIIVVAAPNVQQNFKLQLFDETRLTQQNGLWNIESCVGNTLLREINPSNLRNIPKEKVVGQVKGIINQNYVFMGYVELANYIRKKTENMGEGLDEKERHKLEIRSIRKVFNNRLIIIDEAHNIRLTDDNKDDKTGKLLMKLAKNCKNMRLLLLSATPLYNSYAEIIWIANLMNANDKRGLISHTEVFDDKGDFIKEVKNASGVVLQESGYNLLKRKLIGYVSYVRGENPYTFPYRIYPDTFSPSKTFSNPNQTNGIVNLGQSLFGANEKQLKLPQYQLNGKKIASPLQNAPIYVTNIGSYQSRAYQFLIKNMRGSMKEDAFDELEKFGFQQLQTPLEALNMVYPSAALEEAMSDNVNEDNKTTLSYDFAGKRGLENIVNYVDESNGKVPRKYKYNYKPEIREKYGNIFHQDHIGKYSAKISQICENIRQSHGIVLIYSQYIDGGAVPMALALEEMGFARYSSSPHMTSLFESPPSEAIDAITMKPKELSAKTFRPAKYIMITGDKSYSPKNAEDIKQITRKENAQGENIKVVIISKAGSEGLDFKGIRQVHILEPWYNMNRIEQIIGRAVRQNSHCYLPFQERNVEIYMYATQLERNEEEAADVYVYRLAMSKSKKIGRVTRLMKENSVDCLLNIGQANFTETKMMSLEENRNKELILSTNKRKIQYNIGDKPFSPLCDYMENCDFKCSGNMTNENDVTQTAYSNNYIQSNNQRIMKRIKELYRDKEVGNHFYELKEIIERVNVTKQYPISQIYSALSSFIKNKHEYLVDKYGRIGTMTNKGSIYAFQPLEVTDENASIFERKVPVDVKRNHVVMETAKEFAGKDEEHHENEVTYEDILNTITENMDNATKQHKNDKEREFWVKGEQDWYKHASVVWEHMANAHKVSHKDFVDSIIHHNIDMLMPQEKLIVISHFYEKMGRQYNAIEKVIKTYLDENMVTYKKKSGFLISNTKGWSLYIQSESNASQWEEAEPEDIRNFEISNTLSDKFTKSTAKYFSIIGFINMFRNEKEMVFRLKDIYQMQNNTGLRINALTPYKADIIKRLNIIVDNDNDSSEPMYDIENTKNTMQLGLCVIIEILLRVRSRNLHNDKIWYMNPEEAAYNKIAQYRKPM